MTSRAMTRDRLPGRRAAEIFDDYDGPDDMCRSIEFAYRHIRERVAHGGRGWRGWPEPRPVYVLRLQSPNGDDARRLRWALKKMLRQLGLRGLGALGGLLLINSQIGSSGGRKRGETGRSG
jgi:hypothetical protein